MRTIGSFSQKDNPCALHDQRFRCPANSWGVAHPAWTVWRGYLFL